MRLKSLKGLLAILLATSIAPLLMSTAVAKPLEPNPEWPWVSDAVWGTKLRLENTYIGECWFGAGPTADNGDFFPPPEYVYPVFKYDTTYYDYIVRSQVGAPQSYSWYVEMITNLAYTGATLSTVLENDTHDFVPHDFSIVLENAAENLFINLRENVDNWWVPLPSHATLYVDNAVNATISPSSQTGDYGDNVSFTVTVSNTGRYDDTYDLTVDAGTWSYSIVPSSLTISAGNSATATLTVTLSGGSQVITVTADGAYADDSATCTAAAPLGVINVSISPPENSGENGSIVTFEVTVTNTGVPLDNFDLTVSDDAGWGPSLLDNLLENVQPGENRTTTVSVTVPSDVAENESTQITITAISQADSSVSASGTFTAVAGKKPEPKPEPVSGFPVIPVAISAIIAIIACLAVYRIYWAGR